MPKSGHNNLRSLLETPPPTKNNDNHFSNKLLSAEPSFRILYYGGASGSVPFTWESQPGTPKHTFSDTSLPPLTPPPSYQSQQNSLTLNRSKSSFLRRIFSRKVSSRPSFSWSSSSGSSGSYSSPSTPMNWPSVGGGGRSGKPHFVRSRSVVRFGVEEEKGGGPAGGYVAGSAFCFGVGEGVSKKFNGGGRMNKVKNALMSIVGHAKA